MSTKLCCCLCCKTCSDFKSLRNFWGESNEVYKITVKYFDPWLITENVDVNSYKNSSVICLNCWLHIKDFHDFYETIIKAKSTMERTNTSVLDKQVLTLISDCKYVNGNLDIFQSIVRSNSGKVNEDDILNEEVPTIMDVQNSIEDDWENLNNVDVKPVVEDICILEKENDAVKFANDKTSDSLRDSSNINDNDDTPLSKLVQAQNFKEHKSKESNNKLQYTVTNPSNSLYKGNQSNYHIDRYSKEYFEEIRKKDEFIRKWKSELDCYVCGEKFSIFDDLNEHFKSKHFNNKFYVRCCSRKFFRRCDIIEHINVHINPEFNKCNICGKRSKTKGTHKIHLGTHEKNRATFDCSVCQKKFQYKHTFENHLLIHVKGSKDFKCDQCDKAFIVEYLLKKHLQAFHGRTKICDRCGKKLRDSGALRKHIIAQHSGIVKPKHPCDVCGLELASSFNLKLHKASYHNDGSTVYVCSICDKVFGNEKALKLHRKYSHVYQLKHKCPHCDKAFKRVHALRGHIATHTGEVLYFCDVCPKTFKMQGQRSAHRKKYHPVEWRKGKKVILERKQIDMDRVTNKVVV